MPVRRNWQEKEADFMEKQIEKIIQPGQKNILERNQQAPSAIPARWDWVKRWTER